LFAKWNLDFDRLSPTARTEALNDMFERLSEQWRARYKAMCKAAEESERRFAEFEDGMRRAYERGELEDDLRAHMKMPKPADAGYAEYGRWANG